MLKRGFVCFFEYPSRVDDLRRPCRSEKGKMYEVTVVELERIYYENFITDLAVERDFIEANERVCRIDTDGLWHCIFVRRKGGKDGILVMSDG